MILKKSGSPLKKILEKIYEKLYLDFGAQYWWPAETKFEVIIGAILTQNTSWQNVEKAISNLKSRGYVSLKKLNKIPEKKLAALIRPSGYYNIKASRLKSFIDHIYKNYGGNLGKMLDEPLEELRGELLKIKGIGPETADSIILYAADKPIFVIDAYTKRVLLRHKIIKKDASYHEIQKFFMDNLKNDAKFFNEYHALIVKLSKVFCKKTPDCKNCPLSGIKN